MKDIARGSGRPFLVCALPRSRTAWVANFLTYGQVYCAHELCTVVRSVAEVPYLLRRLGTRYAGNADTAQALILPQLREVLPTAPVVVIRRPVAEVVESLEALAPFGAAERGLTAQAVQVLARHVEAAARVPGALVLEYHELEQEATARALLAHVAPGEPFHRARWAMLAGLQVQLTGERLRAVVREAGANTEAFLAARRTEGETVE